ncbi:MAG: O-antigen ligase family protein [Acidimicrobiales bacterium]|nr:O-antigen ligase family protein [Acidimicrobiales bacterium]
MNEAVIVTDRPVRKKFSLEYGTRSFNVPGAAFIAILVAFGLCCAYIPWGAAAPFVSRFAVLFLTIALGAPLVFWAWSIKTFRLPVVLMALFLLVALVSALLSHQLDIAFFGIYTAGTGWIFYLALFSAWLIGLRCSGSEISVKAITYVISIGAVVNSLFAVIEIATIHSTHGLNGLAIASSGGASGLLINPVFLGQLLSGTIVLVAFTKYLTNRASVVVLFVCGIGDYLSQDRASIIFIAIGVVVLLYRKRLVGLGLSVVLCLGYFAGGLISNFYNGAKVSSRITSGAISTVGSARMVIWKYSIHAFEKSFLIGYGPSGDSKATLPLYGLDMVRATRLPSGYYADAHNVIIELLVCTGVIGTLLVGAFMLSAIRISGGELLWFALAMGVFLLFEPLNIATCPLIFLALGAGVSPREKPKNIVGKVICSVPSIEAKKLKPHIKGARLSLCVLAIIFGISIIWGDIEIDHAGGVLLNFELIKSQDVSFNSGPAKLATLLIPEWSNSNSSLAQSYALAATVGEKSLWQKAIDAQKMAVAKSPYDPVAWTWLAIYEENAGNKVVAYQDYLKAVKLDPLWLGGINMLCEIQSSKSIKVNYDWCKDSAMIQSAVNGH